MHCCYWDAQYAMVLVEHYCLVFFCSSSSFAPSLTLPLNLILVVLLELTTGHQLLNLRQGIDSMINTPIDSTPKTQAIALLQWKASKPPKGTCHVTITAEHIMHCLGAALLLNPIHALFGCRVIVGSHSYTVWDCTVIACRQNNEQQCSQKLKDQCPAAAVARNM